jgi:hypothetical protein
MDTTPTPRYAAGNDGECALCMQPLCVPSLLLPDVVETLCCGHVFHYFCRCRLRNQQRCPVCRTSLAETHVCDLLCAADEEDDYDDDEDDQDGSVGCSIGLCQKFADVADTVIDGGALVIAEGAHRVLLRLDDARACVESSRGAAGGFTRLDVLRAVFEAWGGREDTRVHTLVRLGNGDYEVKYDS